MRKITCLVSIVLVILCSCDNEDNGPTRSFYMGFTPFPYAVSMDAVNFSYASIATEADIINQHLEEGIPWNEAYTDETFHSNILNDWTFRKNSIPAGHKVIVSVTPLNFLRTGLENYRADKDDMPLPAPWDNYRFNDDHVKKAYLNYCKRAINFFNPHYFNMAIEANLVYWQNPALWSDFLELHEYIYAQLKTLYPTLTIFSSVTGQHMLDKFFSGNDFHQQRLAVSQILDHSDMYALSFYPYMSNYLGNPYPASTFDDLFSISDKPLAIAETGYAAQSFNIDTGSGVVTINSDQAKQDKYIADLLNACTKHRAKFVINFVVRDYDDLWQTLGAKNDLSIAWRDSGLLDENGNKRSALATWRSYLGRPLSK